jgi:uncharacterized protein
VDSGISERTAAVASDALPETAFTAVKIVVAGGFGVGKTTLVGTVSEITPLSTEDEMTSVGAGVDDLLGVEEKTTTTVAFDFGRITLDPELVLYLFGAPGQKRFWFFWDTLFTGALGGVVLIDTRRIGDSFAAVDRLEAAGIPFVVALNVFAPLTHTEEQVRAALDLGADIPVVVCDARSPESGKKVLITLVEYLQALYTPVWESSS